VATLRLPDVRHGSHGRDRASDAPTLERLEGVCALEIPFGVFLREVLAVSTLKQRTLHVAGSGQPGSFPSPFTNRE
jgi:hypothetical protein